MAKICFSFLVPHQEIACWLKPFSTLIAAARTNLPRGALKMKNPSGNSVDSGARNRYFYAPTCATKRKPEEARRPGSVLEEP